MFSLTFLNVNYIATLKYYIAFLPHVSPDRLIQASFGISTDLAMSFVCAYIES